MSLKKILVRLAGLQFALCPMVVHAQSSDFNRGFERQGAEARLSLTIPLGRSSDKTKTAPRLNLGVRHYAQPSLLASTDWMRADRQVVRDVKLGFTLESTPKLMLNDQLLQPLESEQANIGTAGKIGLGLVAATLVAGAIAVVALARADFGDE